MQKKIEMRLQLSLIFLIKVHRITPISCWLLKILQNQFHKAQPCLLGASEVLNQVTIFSIELLCVDLYAIQNSHYLQDFPIFLCYTEPQEFYKNLRKRFSLQLQFHQPLNATSLVPISHLILNVHRQTQKQIRIKLIRFNGLNTKL